DQATKVYVVLFQRSGVTAPRACGMPTTLATDVPPRTTRLSNTSGSPAGLLARVTRVRFGCTSTKLVEVAPLELTAVKRTRYQTRGDGSTSAATNSPPAAPGLIWTSRAWRPAPLGLPSRMKNTTKISRPGT